MYDNAQVTDTDTIEIKAPKTVSEETLGYLQDWDAFANPAQADFTQQAPAHLDTRNIVDFYLLLAAIGATDLFAGDKAKTRFLYGTGQSGISGRMTSIPLTGCITTARRLVMPLIQHRNRRRYVLEKYWSRMLTSWPPVTPNSAIKIFSA